jgi:phosphoglycolate phosphatase-like HAD superfamily hydrolase
VLCTKCSTPVTPVVAIDIDGTLGDYHGHFLTFARSYFLTPPRAHRVYNGSGSFKRWWMKEFMRSEKDWHDVKLAYRQGGMKRTMPIRPNARHLMQYIKEREKVELWVTTTRPYLSLDNIVPDTIEWLHRHNIFDYDGILFDEDKYEQLAERVDPDRIVAVVDDLVDMCLHADDVLGRSVSIMAANKYNTGVSWPIKLTLEETTPEILKRIAAWKGIYDKRI